MRFDTHRKTGADNPDRDAQFHFLNDEVQTALGECQPVISVTRKKELVDRAEWQLPRFALAIRPAMGR